MDFLHLLGWGTATDYQVITFVIVVGGVLLATLLLSAVKLFAHRGRLINQNLDGLAPFQSRKSGRKDRDAKGDSKEESDDSDADCERKITVMESQVEAMFKDLEALKDAGSAKEKNKETAPVASTSNPQQFNAPSKKKTITYDDVLTFQQKRDLSEAIGKLDGACIEQVIQIIREGVPEIRDGTDDIEVDIDQLPAAVLTKLYNYVISKRTLPAKVMNTGGPKCRSMDEQKEKETKKLPQEENGIALDENEVFTYEQKKDISDAICKLDGARLERVIQIVHGGLPEIRDSTEEIELDIDQLSPAVLTKLYNYLLRRPVQPTRKTTGKDIDSGDAPNSSCSDSELKYPEIS